MIHAKRGKTLIKTKDPRSEDCRAISEGHCRGRTGSVLCCVTAICGKTSAKLCRIPVPVEISLKRSAWAVP